MPEAVAVVPGKDQLFIKLVLAEYQVEIYLCSGGKDNFLCIAPPQRAYEIAKLMEPKGAKNLHVWFLDNGFDITI